LCGAIRERMDEGQLSITVAIFLFTVIMPTFCFSLRT